MGVPALIEQTFADTLTPAEIAAFAGLLDALDSEGFAAAGLEARTAIVHGFRDQDPEAKLGLHSLKALTMLFFYALPDEQGSNPNWEALGYPGALSPPPAPEHAPKTIALEEVSGESATLECDVCVVGSGSGGGVIAARCAKAGRSVLVLEMGGYRNEADFKQLELPAMQELYYGGGLAASEDGSISILAGQTLGGGTVVNYMNCIPTPERIVEEWGSHGLTGLDDYDAYKREHVDVVMERINANTEATTQNETHQKLMAACDALGYEHRPIVRNVSLDDDPEQCGFLFEATSMHPGIVSASMPWESGQAHKELMQPFRWLAPFITVARDHGWGEVVIDDLGRPVVRWASRTRWTVAWRCAPTWSWRGCTRPRAPRRSTPSTRARSAGARATTSTTTCRGSSRRATRPTT
jgi:hypothetical protein